MKIPNLSKAFAATKLIASAHRPEILLAASITTTLAAVVMAAKGGYEARGIVDKAEGRTFPEDIADIKPLSAKEKANLTWHCYLPAATLTVGAIGSTAGLHIVHVKEKKALAYTALAAIEEVKTQAKQFEKENAGVLSEEEKSNILEERADGSPFGIAQIEGQDGLLEDMYVVRDARTGRDVWSNQHRIENAIIECKNVIAGGGGAEGEGDCDLNYFYNMAGFPIIPDGNSYGWSGVLPELKWTETTRNDGRPVRVFSFRPEPTKDRGLA